MEVNSSTVRHSRADQEVPRQGFLLVKSKFRFPSSLRKITCRVQKRDLPQTNIVISQNFSMNPIFGPGNMKFQVENESLLVSFVYDGGCSSVVERRSSNSKLAAGAWQPTRRSGPRRLAL